MYVQPAEGDLPPVDREYYVMQSVFYHEPLEVKRGAFGCWNMAGKPLG